MSWLQRVPEVPVIAGLQMVLDPSDERGRWPRRSPRGVVQINEDTGEKFIIMPYASEGDRLLVAELREYSRLDLEHGPTRYYAVCLLKGEVSLESSLENIAEALLETFSPTGG